jgi:hypothetical protein
MPPSLWRNCRSRRRNPLFLLPFQGHRESDCVIIAQSVGPQTRTRGHLLKLRGQFKVIEIWTRCAARLKCSCTTGGRFAMKLGSPIGWPQCQYESGTPMPPVLMPGERTGRPCHREANGRQRPNTGLMAAAALTEQSEQRPSRRSRDTERGWYWNPSSTSSYKLCGLSQE